jgi:hypothetical protein
MSVFKKFTRNITSALFTRALGEVFDWGHSVPAGERPRYVPAPDEHRDADPAAHNWAEPVSQRTVAG